MTGVSGLSVTLSRRHRFATRVFVVCVDNTSAVLEREDHYLGLCQSVSQVLEVVEAEYFS